MSGSLYWLFVALLLAFGLVSILSIGAPFLLLGLTLAVLAPYRKRSRVFWPWLVGVLGFIVGYVLVAPLSCTSEVSLVIRGVPGAVETETGSTTCRSVLPIRYSGRNPYSPPLWPALIVGLLVSFGAGAVTRLAMKDQRGGGKP